MQFGIFSVSDITRDPMTDYTPSEAERIDAVVKIAQKTEEEVEELERAFGVIKEAYRLGVGTLAAKDAFYGVLFRGARNEQLRQVTAGLHARVTYLRSFSLAQPGRLQESLAELRDIMNAVKARDADAVARACLYHIKRAGEASIGALPSDPVEA